MSTSEHAAVHLRDATRADLPSLLALYEGSGVDAVGSNDLEHAAAQWDAIHRIAHARVLVAERDAAVVGTLTLFVLPLLAHGGAPEALVESVVVHRDAQGQGIGRAMMQHAMRIAAEHRCYKLALTSNVQRPGAHAFYDRLGFQRHGVSFVVAPGGRHE
jgi:GNAT superfamily N-acetyltransferase